MKHTAIFFVASLFLTQISTHMDKQSIHIQEIVIKNNLSSIMLNFGFY